MYAILGNHRHLTLDWFPWTSVHHLHKICRIHLSGPDKEKNLTKFYI